VANRSFTSLLKTDTVDCLWAGTGGSALFTYRSTPLGGGSSGWKYDISVSLALCEELGSLVLRGRGILEVMLMVEECWNAASQACLKICSKIEV
jgi:hypothetical protein